jgi:Leucine-rich repeat (LRR) protein
VIGFMRYFLLITILTLILLPTMAQDESSLTPYEIALERIEGVRTHRREGLHLENLALTELPPEIAELAHLERLYLSGNLLTTLPSELFELSNLQILNLENNRLTSLPAEIGALGNLEWLNLDSNQVLSFPREMGNLSRLRFLSINFNQLSEFPVELTLVRNLEWLELDGNQLTELPPEIGNLRQLEYLSLWNNLLKDLPDELRQIDSLCAINIRNNQFTELPYFLVEFRKFTSVLDCPSNVTVGIHAEDNPLISPPQEVVWQGSQAVLQYLRNEAWWHLKRLIAGGAGAIGLVAAIVLGLRWKNRRRGKEKEKRFS